jgi:phage-related protein
MGLDIKILAAAAKYIEKKLKTSEKGALMADLEAIASGELDSVSTKKLRGKIYELIVGDHRFTYFQDGNALYFVSGFRKKTNKTPKKEVEHSEKIYKMFKKRK